MLANTFQYSCLANSPNREAWQATVHRVAKSWTGPKQPWVHRCKTLFVCLFVWPVAALPQWGLSMKAVQLLGLPGLWWHQMCRDTDCFHCRSHGPIRVFFWTSSSSLIGKDPDAGKDWRQKEKKVIADEMVGWHHWFNGYEFGQAPGDGEGQESLACCSPRDCEEQVGSWTTPNQIITLFTLNLHNVLCQLYLNILEEKKPKP